MTTTTRVYWTPVLTSLAMGADDLLTRQQAAALLGVGLRQLHRYQDSRQLPFERNHAGRIRFRRSAIESFRVRRDSYEPVQLAG